MSHMSRALAWAPVRLARKRQRRPPGLDTSVLADYDAIHSTKWARRAAFRWGATMLGRTWDRAAQRLGRGGRLALAAGVLSSGTIVFAMAGPAGAATVHTVTVGELTDEGGSCAAPGIPTAKGVALAVKQINEHPFTVAGKQYTIDLKPENTNSDNTTAVNDLVSLTQNDGAKIVIGPGCGAYVEPGLGPLAVKEKILLFNPFPSATMDNPATAVSYAKGAGSLIAISQASSGQTAEAQGALVTLFPKSDSIKSVYLLLEDDEEGHTFGASLGKYFTTHGYKLTTAYYPDGTQDFSGYLSAVKASSSDLLMYGYGDPSGLAILKQAVALNAAPNYYGWGSALSDATGVNGPTGIQEPQVALVYPVSLQYPTNAKIAEFAKQFEAFNGGTLGSDSSYAAYLYDDPGLLVKAMEKANSTTNLPAIAKALYSLKYNGLLSSDEYFDSSHHLHFEVDGCYVAPGENPTAHVTCKSVPQ